jgi:hypothetical protein
MWKKPIECSIFEEKFRIEKIFKNYHNFNTYFFTFLLFLYIMSAPDIRDKSPEEAETLIRAHMAMKGNESEVDRKLANKAVLTQKYKENMKKTLTDPLTKSVGEDVNEAIKSQYIIDSRFPKIKLSMPELKPYRAYRKNGKLFQYPIKKALYTYLSKDSDPGEIIVALKKLLGQKYTKNYNEIFQYDPNFNRTFLKDLGNIEGTPASEDWDIATKLMQEFLNEYEYNAGETSEMNGGGISPDEMKFEQLLRAYQGGNNGSVVILKMLKLAMKLLDTNDYINFSKEIFTTMWI